MAETFNALIYGCYVYGRVLSKRAFVNYEKMVEMIEQL